MRPINVTLCSHTWELAKRKNNFSGWVRMKLDEEEKNRSEPKVLYGMYCASCDANFKHPVEDIAKIYRCRHCDSETEFMGELE